MKWVEDKEEEYPHIVWKLVDENGLLLDSIFNEYLHNEEYMLDEETIMEKKRNRTKSYL